MDNTFFIFIMFRYGVSGIRKELYIWSVLNMDYLTTVCMLASLEKDVSSSCVCIQLGLIFSSGLKDHCRFELFPQYYMSTQSARILSNRPNWVHPSRVSVAPPLAIKGGRHTRLKSGGEANSDFRLYF
jgi:hypothetical protein